jgi:predicted secreted hydrolase
MGAFVTGCIWPAALARPAGSDRLRTDPSPLASSQSPVTQYPDVLPGYRIRFPEDEGSHPAFRTEWWYITGWLQRERTPLGFQITFFRVRAQIDESNPSAFTARQIIIAHAALSDAGRGRLLSDEKLARASLGLAGADHGRTRVWIGGWALTQHGAEYRLRIPAHDFAMDFTFTPTQPPLLQGENGLSRKGPNAESASYYYSIPQLRVSGTLAERTRTDGISGSAWLDHEWSSSYMDERASGWDWVGINFDDGGALMAFRMRGRDGGTFWAGGAYRRPDGTRRAFAEKEVEFTPTRVWRSPRTGASYPVACRISVPGMVVTIEPLMDDQEHDTRGSVGTVYWEGAVTALIEGKPSGRGYLELTGYWQKMKL